jgi:pimeloyl-ACP methyl ester carboxylesterase
MSRFVGAGPAGRQSAAIEYVEATGGRIEYQWVGTGEPGHPALVFLHDGLGCVAMWGRFPQALASAARLRALVYSRFGHGGSDPLPRPRTDRFLHDEALDVLPALLERLAVAAPVLVGQSDGASIALIHAAARPTSVAGLILEAPHVFAEQLTIDGVARTCRRFAENADFRRKFSRYHRDAAAVVAQWNDAWLSPSFRRWTIEEALVEVVCPVLLLQSSCDPYGSRLHLDKIANRVQGPVSTVILPGDSHSPHRDHHARVLHEMTGFLARLPVVS